MASDSLRPHVLITRRPPGDAIAMIEAGASIDLWPENEPMPRGALLERVADVDGLYAMLTDTVDEELLDRAPRLRVVSNMAVGVDNVDVAACTARRIPVGHTPDVLTETTADMAFALLMAAARRLVEGVDYVRGGRWRRWEPDLLLGRDVHSTTVGIIGPGRIGTAVARRAQGFGMDILYTARRRHESIERDLGASFRPLGELLAEADHVVVTVPLTEETRRLIDADALAAMKPTATLVNVSRGPIVDTSALRRALAEGSIGSAGLDVTDPEPIAPDDPLLEMPNCVVTPHLGSASERTRAAMAELAARNLIAGLAGEPLPASVNQSNIG